jgi:hypothetical protein
MLRDVIAVESSLIREFYDLQLILKHLVEGSITPLDPVEYPEFQRNIRERDITHGLSYFKQVSRTNPELNSFDQKSSSIF